MKYEYAKSLDRGNPSAPLIRTPRVDFELFGPKGSIKVPFALVDSGADYCLRKPFGPLELLARINSLLQRTQPRQPVSTIS